MRIRILVTFAVVLKVYFYIKIRLYVVTLPNRSMKIPTVRRYNYKSLVSEG